MSKRAVSGGSAGTFAGIGAVVALLAAILYASGQFDRFFNGSPEVSEAPDEPEAAEAAGTAGEAPLAEPAPEPVETTEALDPGVPDDTTADAEPDLSEPEPQPTESAGEPAAPEPNETVSDTPADAPAEEASPTLVPAPSFDVVRVAPDGNTVIAGRASPGAELTLFLDGGEVSRATADATGGFVMLLDLGASASARLLTLAEDAPDGPVFAGSEVVLAPSQAAVADESPVTEEMERAETGTEAAEPARRSETGTAPATVAEADAPGGAASQAAPESTEEIAAAPPVEPASAPEPGADQPEVAAAPEPEPASPEPGPEAPAEAPTAVLLSGPSGVEVVQPATEPAEPPEGDFVSLDAISYDDVGAVSLTGRANPNGSVRIYLDNDEIALTDVGDSGRWRAALPDAEPGTYTLRLDRVDTEGRVLARIESPFQRESRAVLEAAAPDEDAPVYAVTVQPGNTLWGISRERYGEGVLYVKVFEANKDQIRDPDLIYPGQVFALPE